MGVLGQLGRRGKWLAYTRRFGPAWAGFLESNSIWPLETATVDRAGSLVVPELDLVFGKRDRIALTILRARSTATALRKRAGARYEMQEDSVLVDLDGLRFTVSTEPDLVTAFEIYVEEIYRFGLPGSYYVLDIGANIGLAALYFAHAFDAVVESFELVPSTAALARQNIGLNPGLAEHITVNEFGLSDADGQFEIAVDPTCRPGNSLYDEKTNERLSKETVEVRDVASVFGEALRRRGDRKLIVKLDAEGAEYEIVQRLLDEGLFGEIDLLLLEWHARKGKDSQYFRDVLTMAGFRWTERRHPDAPVGLMNAFRV